ncbi:MAG TPA: coenzyme F420-reducing hydrogenase, FrhD protein [Methanoregulaceae archaeon]|nr:coenzyme F420-reducing hydrogenase, FrhD protein [Methanolinea sp.]HPJ73814.1 coenzyme F420-reducing hydrogenase, FrhD protein [Methanoregulaceae archaeon]HPQ75479.1 coenzyme F420-reducing hydrogenase, FrhD protein [Methanoregulaceae archaeon]HRX34118.1 coenzyme F420-reducing hydrogenase, FrhD protein [Methanoregulaceae archaeon]
MAFTEIVITGCGNPLFADDGFGPAVVEELSRLSLPDTVKVVDAGLGGPHFIFTLLDPEVTKRLIIIDIADFGGEPGQIVDLKVEDLPPGSYRDAHSWDLTEPLHRIKDDIDITVICCQPKRVTAPEFEMGLSPEVEGAIPRTVQYVLELIGVDYGIAIKNLRKEECQREAEGEACGDS